MKWVKIVVGCILGLLILATAALAVANMGGDSNRLLASTVINAKPEAVWPWIYKPDKVKQWVSWLVEIREDREGEPTVGGKAVWVMEDRNNNNARMEITGVVAAVEPYRRIAVNLSAPEGFNGTATYLLTPQPDGSTLLTSDSRYMMDNAFARFMTPLVCWQAKKKMVADMEQLKKLVESTPK